MKSICRTSGYDAVKLWRNIARSFLLLAFLNLCMALYDEFLYHGKQRATALDAGLEEIVFYMYGNMLYADIDYNI